MIDTEKTDSVMFNTLKKDLINWESDKMKPIWTEGKTWDVITQMIHEDLMNNRKVQVKNPEDLKKYQSKNE